jgi:hypothetical protein
MNAKSHLEKEDFDSEYPKRKLKLNKINKLNELKHLIN